MGKCTKSPVTALRFLAKPRSGGVRGIVELEILKTLEKELGAGVNIQEFFDLIVGTR